MLIVSLKGVSLPRVGRVTDLKCCTTLTRFYCMAVKKLIELQFKNSMTTGEEDRHAKV